MDDEFRLEVNALPVLSSIAESFEDRMGDEDGHCPFHLLEQEANRYIPWLYRYA